MPYIQTLIEKDGNIELRQDEYDAELMLFYKSNWRLDRKANNCIRLWDKHGKEVDMQGLKLVVYSEKEIKEGNNHE